MNDSSEEKEATQAAETAAERAGETGSPPAEVKQEAKQAAKQAAPKLGGDQIEAIATASAASTMAALREEGALVTEEEQDARRDVSRETEQPAGEPPPAAPAGAPPAEQARPVKRNLAQRFLKDD